MTKAQQILDNVKGLKTVDRDQYLLDKTQGTLTSTVIGGGIGLLIAYNRKKNLLVGAIVGGALAGLVAHYFVNKDN